MKRSIWLSKIGSCGLAVLILAACHGSGTAAKTYVNQNNPGETMTLEGRVSVTNSIYNRFLQDLRIDKGVYTLKTANGTTRGTYSYTVNPKALQKISYIFKPEQGKEWGVEVHADQSFKDDHGTWKLETGSLNKIEAAKGAQLTK